MEVLPCNQWNCSVLANSPLGLPVFLIRRRLILAALASKRRRESVTARFVLDESSWAAATGADSGVLSNAIQHLLERLDVARERNEGVVRHGDYYETALGDGVQLYSARVRTRLSMCNLIVTSLSGLGWPSTESKSSTMPS